MNQGTKTSNATGVIAQIFPGRLLPAVNVHSPDAAVQVARAILAGGLGVMEIPFRHPNAPQCISAVRRAVPEMLVGAGTLLTVVQMESARGGGAQFGVSPGFNPTIVRAALSAGFPFLPGVATPGEIEQAMELGLTAAKVFPIKQLGGVAYLKALCGPYLHTGFRVIPMGGIDLQNLESYLEVPIVGAVGGSWLADSDVIEAKNWSAITTATRGSMRIVASHEIIQ